MTASRPPEGSLPVPRPTIPEERPARPEAETLAFEVREGDTTNLFFRRGPVAAHLLATSGTAPRVVVAFPAGNSGIGIWFEPAEARVELHVDSAVAAVERADGMRGIALVLRMSCASVPPIRDVTLGSLRMLRGYARTGQVPPEMTAATSNDGTAWHRTMLDGAPIEVTLEPLAVGAPGAVALRLTALTGAAPLTPIPMSRLVTGAAPGRDLQALAFLSYEEKLLAGSWRFLTYFGRDTLLSLRLLMPVLEPAVVAAALGSVIDRLSSDGDVAHEEEIGEWASFTRRRRAGGDPDRSHAPIFDYKMIDDDFLLAPVLAHWLFDTPAGWQSAEAFMARRTPSGRTYAEAVRANLDRVLRRCRPFAVHPGIETLIALREGECAGQWRDSSEGLGRGRIPYDVNAALVPAALEAAERLFASTLCGPGAVAAQEAARLAKAWTRAPAIFDVSISASEARARLGAYSEEIGLDAAAALAAIDGPVEFPALALEAAGAPIPILHSDDGFVLLFTKPSPPALLGAARRILQPFPAGLRTPVGIVVANPAYAGDPALRRLFTTGHYHGTVVWSWQQALLAAGLRRQLQRGDLPPPVRATLLRAEEALWDVIRATRANSTTELWSFAIEGGRFVRVPFGQNSGDADESNAAQLWSTVYLAVAPIRSDT